jgi:carboxyl-terminal processing protease
VDEQGDLPQTGPAPTDPQKEDAPSPALANLLKEAECRDAREAAREKAAFARVRRRRVLGRLGVFFLTILTIALIFITGNLSASHGFVDVGRLLDPQASQTQGASAADAEVPAAQLAARLDEVATILDTQALYRYTQGDLDEATATAIRSLIETSGDAYAQYYTSEEYAEYLRSSEGEYSGIGVVFAMVDGQITAVQVYEDSPAFDAGVAVGDVLLAVNGDRHDWEFADAIEAIRDFGGESVTITWQRGDDERDTVLAPREVSVPTIVSHLIERDGQTIGYVNLRRFNMHSEAELGDALKNLEGQGAQSYILDLRGNLGGYLSQAIGVTSLFVPEGIVVQIEDRRGITVERVTGAMVTTKPLVVLVDGSSASASELAAAALKDHGRATIVGVVTYGKGTVQNFHELSWGGALKYTFAHYMSPNGTTLDGVGVTPDVAVEPTTGLEGIGLSDHLVSSSYLYREGVDTQLDAALLALLDPAAEGSSPQDGSP